MIGSSECEMRNNAMPEMGKIYNAREASGYLGVTEATIKKYLRDGHLSGKRVGLRKEWRISGEEIIRWGRVNMIDGFV